MNTKKQAPSVPTGAIPQYRQHFREHKAAQARYDAAMDGPEYAAAIDSLAAALTRIRATHPEDAKSIANAFDVMTSTWDTACAALTEAWYHECCRRSLAPSVVSAKKSARKARARWEDDPSTLAKAEAMQLWPVANRQGWTATRLHTELVSRGHTVTADTVRKWATKLRKTGLC